MVIEVSGRALFVPQGPLFPCVRFTYNIYDYFLSYNQETDKLSGEKSESFSWDTNPCYATRQRLIYFARITRC